MIKQKNAKFKSITAIILALMVVLSFAGCGEKKEQGYTPVPNVMGIMHNDAKKVLEGAGFEVTEVEADASSILPNARLSHNRSVKQGEVFKVNDETDPKYSDSEKSPMAKDGKVVIYYAKEDYDHTKPVFEPIDADDLPVKSGDISISIAEDEVGGKIRVSFIYENKSNHFVTYVYKKFVFNSDITKEDVANFKYEEWKADYELGEIFFEAKYDYTLNPGEKSESRYIQRNGNNLVGSFEEMTKTTIESTTYKYIDNNIKYTVIYDSITQTYSRDKGVSVDTPVELKTTTPKDETHTNKDNNSSGNSEWKQFLKDYEKWVDDYIAILKKYEKNPSDLSIMSDYMEMMGRLTEWSDRADKIEADLANDTQALKEYTETLTRIIAKLSNYQ